MKNRETTNFLYKVHSWTGLILSVPVLVLCISGMISLFHDELQLWEQPVYRNIENLKKKTLHETVQNVLARYDLNSYRSIRIELPDINHRALRFTIPVNNQAEKIVVDINPVTLERLNTNKYQLADFFRHIHRQFLLPYSLGSTIVGIVGFMMTFTIVIGILLHKKFFKAFFTFRYQKSMRLLISDSHKLFGLWALLFHIMIAITGGYLGMAYAMDQLVTRAADLTTSKLEIEAVGRADKNPLYESAEMANLDTIIRISKMTIPDSNPHYLILYNWGDGNGQVSVRSLLPYQLSAYAELNFNAVSGELNNSLIYSEVAGLFRRAYEVIKTLHVAYYLNFWLKFAYFIISTLTVLLAFSGLLLWIESKKRQYSNAAISKIYQLVLGVNLGFVFSIAVLILGHKLAGMFLEINNYPRFYTLVLLASWIFFILTCLYTKNTVKIFMNWLLLLSLILILAALSNVLLNPVEFSWPIPTENWPIIITDLFLFGFSALFLTVWLLVKIRVFRLSARRSN